MLTVYEFLIYWTFSGYVAAISLYLIDKYLNYKVINSVKYVRINIKPWQFLVIIIACGPGIALTALIIFVVDFYKGNWS